MNTLDTEWGKDDREIAQEAFNILGKFFMKNCNRVPKSMLEACDYVSNYLGDIAMGRKITIDKLEDAFPSLKADWLRSEIEKLERQFKEVSKLEVLPEDGYNQALTSIITRYKEELKVLEK